MVHSTNYPVFWGGVVLKPLHYAYLRSLQMDLNGMMYDHPIFTFSVILLYFVCLAI